MGSLFKKEAEEMGDVNHVGSQDHVMEFAYCNTRKGVSDKN